MTTDDIIHMAREAGLAFDSEEYPDIWQTYMYVGREEIERFAALVISHHVKKTRPEVSDSMATWLQQIAYQHGGIGDLSRTEMEFGAMVAAAEREACERLKHAMREAMYLLDQPKPRVHAAFNELLCALNPELRETKEQE